MPAPRDIDGSRISTNDHSRRRFGTVNSLRLYPYVAIAIYDATIAAWDSKYAYNRPRPAELDASLTTRLSTPNSPSYPSEHAAVAAAAAGVLAYFFPNEANALNAWAEEAARSRFTPDCISERQCSGSGTRQKSGRSRHRASQGG